MDTEMEIAIGEGAVRPSLEARGEAISTAEAFPGSAYSSPSFFLISEVHESSIPISRERVIFFSGTYDGRR